MKRARLWLLLALVLPGCGGGLHLVTGDASSPVAPSPTQPSRSPDRGGSAPASGCDALADVFEFDVEPDAEYVPTTDQVVFTTEAGRFVVDLADRACRAKHPRLAALAASYRRSYLQSRHFECASVTDQLRKLGRDGLLGPDATITTARGVVLVTALVSYAEEVCGGPIPGITAQWPCDPSLGDPRHAPACPNDSPLTAQLTRFEDGHLDLEVFHTLHSDTTGQAYAAAHDLEFPFPNDYYDAPTGEVVSLDLGTDTVCTGSILAGFGAQDRLMRCRRFATALAFHGFPVPVAVWQHRGRVVQVSELYRP
ncbi:MAG: hypothetical protein R2731_18505 [Nocardioides sp.]